MKLRIMGAQVFAQSRRLEVRVQVLKGPVNASNLVSRTDPKISFKGKVLRSFGGPCENKHLVEMKRIIKAKVLDSLRYIP